MKLKARQTAALFSNLGFMMTSGITLKDSLAALSEYGERNIRKTAEILKRETESGAMLWYAVKKHEKIIGKGYYKQLKVGEQIGKTGETLKNLAVRINAERRTSEKVKSAMIYPAAVLIITAIAAWYMFTGVVPQIAETLKSLGGELPKLTVAVIAISNFLAVNGLKLMAFLAAAFLALKWVLKHPLKTQSGKAVLHIPMFGRIERNREYFSFYRSMSGLIKSGSPIAEAIKAASETLRNPFVQMEIENAGANFYANGSSLPEALKEVKSMDKTELTAISAGVRTGNVSEIFDALVKRLEAENEELMKRMFAMLDPAMLVLIGTVVGTVLFAVYIPIFSVMSI